MKRIGKVTGEVTCTHCPHTTLYEYSAPYGTAIWCPCEDCHPGGLIQGREPFRGGRTAPTTFVPQVAAPLVALDEDEYAHLDVFHN